MLRAATEGDVMTVKHTQEPWAVSENGLDILAESQGAENGWYELATVSGELSTADDAANAERIAACVNACKGIDPEAVPAMLEALGGMLKYFASYEAEYDCELSEFAAARAAIEAATVTP